MSDYLAISQLIEETGDLEALRALGRRVAKTAGLTPLELELLRDKFARQQKLARMVVKRKTKLRESRELYWGSPADAHATDRPR